VPSLAASRGCHGDVLETVRAISVARQPSLQRGAGGALIDVPPPPPPPPPRPFNS
jgi:hypothetical protein